VTATVADLHEVAPLVRAICRSRLGDDGEDVAQEALLALWLGLHRYNPARGSFAGWARGVTRNKLGDAYRRAGANRSVPMGEWDEHLPDPVTGPEELAVQADTTARLRRHVDQLPPRQRQVVVGRFFEGLTCVETATALGVPVGTAKSTQHAAVRNLQRLGVVA